MSRTCIFHLSAQLNFVFEQSCRDSQKHVSLFLMSKSTKLSEEETASLYLFCKLECIANEVGQNLTKPEGISNRTTRYIGMDIKNQLCMCFNALASILFCTKTLIIPIPLPVAIVAKLSKESASRSCKSKSVNSSRTFPSSSFDRSNTSLIRIYYF